MARDLIHQPVKNALINDGWTVTHDPFPIRYRTFRLSADLKAKRSFVAVKGDEQIVVEIKSFISLSRIQDFKLAIGQYVIYAIYLRESEVTADHTLYLAVDAAVYDEYLSQPEIELIVETIGVSLVVIDTQTEQITQWITRPFMIP